MASRRVGRAGPAADARRPGLADAVQHLSHRRPAAGPDRQPGLASLRAVAHPAHTDDLYFVADGTGGHSFARTLDEHNRNVVHLAGPGRGDRPLSLQPGEQRRAQVALGEARGDRRRSACPRWPARAPAPARRAAPHRRKCRSAAPPAARRAPRRGDRLALGHPHHLVHQPQFEHRRAGTRRRCPGCRAARARRPTAPRFRPARPAPRCSPGRRGFSARAMPVSVPPVPAPPTTMSTRPPVSAQISSAVVAAWMSGLAGLSNWPRHPGARRGGEDRLGAGDGAGHALAGRRQLAPRPPSGAASCAARPRRPPAW